MKSITILIILALSGCAAKKEDKDYGFTKYDDYEVYCYNGHLYITSKHGTEKLYETCLGEQ